MSLRQRETTSPLRSRDPSSFWIAALPLRGTSTFDIHISEMSGISVQNIDLPQPRPRSSQPTSFQLFQTWLPNGKPARTTVVVRRSHSDRQRGNLPFDGEFESGRSCFMTEAQDQAPWLLI
ncbi:hypothetical protein IV203_038316 [Nitzschia inconspicua]|uniref:Uncharacterized protein n=1 Tax=Nitzschia inconspicua TaxID=303405 RepID=A0A9K3PZ58_9STRA|nr:hypothetical protein IV203_038316 [Nitzschia inconspicua]